MNGKSGPQVAAENLARFRIWIRDREHAKDWADYCVVTSSAAQILQQNAALAPLPCARTPRFKREAVKLAGQSGASNTAIGHDLGIGANLLARSCRNAKLEAEVAVGREKVPAQEYERMRREPPKVKTERVILRKGAWPLCSRP